MPAPRASHTSTYVPPSIAGSSYPRGYLLLVGGMQLGHATSDVELLDLETLAWQNISPVVLDASPSKRACHSATLLHRHGRHAAIMIVGGAACGRGGSSQDLRDAFWLDGLKNADLFWTVACSAHIPCAGIRCTDRGHVACRISGTNSMLLLCGGRTGTAFVDGCPRAVNVVGQTVPEIRLYSGACGLQDGTVLMYGGQGSDDCVFDDVWVAHTGYKTEFFLQVQRELSFLGKMQRRVMGGQQIGDSSEEDYPEVRFTSQQEGQALVDDFVADLEDSDADDKAGHNDDGTDESEDFLGNACAS